MGGQRSRSREIKPFSLADLVALPIADREAKARALAEAKLNEGDVKKEK